MTIERQDGPVKHYRMVCNSCGKRTKRQAYEFNFSEYADIGWKEYKPDDDNPPPGWKEEDGWDPAHYCPKCAGSLAQDAAKEIVPNVGDSVEISDHNAVELPLTREGNNRLVINCQEGGRLIITSSTKIKVEHTEE